jgi:hypothetical protein
LQPTIIVEDWQPGSAYEEMTQSLKIFMYSSDLDAEQKHSVHWKYGVEDLFIKLLSRSRFVTKVGPYTIPSQLSL